MPVVKHGSKRGKSYLTTVPKLVVSLSHSVVTTSVLVVRSGRSLALQFTATNAKGNVYNSRSIPTRIECLLTIASLWHQVIPLPIEPVVSPSLACHLPLTL